MTQMLEENIVLDNNVNRCYLTIQSYKNLNIVEKNDFSVVFSDNHNHVFTCFLLNSDYDLNGNLPFIMANNCEDDFPHFILSSIDIEDTNYRYICLHQREQYVVSNLSLEEKLEFLLNNLKRLTSLNKKQIEGEFQKEFLYYWNSMVSSNFRPHVFIECDDSYKELSCYLNSGSVRVVSEKIQLNDISNWKKTSSCAVYVPLVNIEGIVPPTKNTPWKEKDILNIFQNTQINKISTQTYEKIKSCVISKRKIDIYFTLPVDERKILFGCRINFKNAGSAKLLEKIKEGVASIEPFIISREDFQYLNESIGNSIIKKTVGVVGAGSLGSHISKELVNSGVKNLVLIDDDILSTENIFRHTLDFNMVGFNKSLALKHILEQKHPEIHVNYLKEKVTNSNLKKFVDEFNIDYLVFCIGSTDQQYDISKRLSHQSLDTVIIYSWLDQNAVDSYTLITFDNKKCCYSCGKNYIEQAFPPESNLEDDKHWLNDGCGGTRVKYGNRTLLSAVNGFLNVFEKSFSSTEPFAIRSNIKYGISEFVTIKNSGCEFCD